MSDQDDSDWDDDDHDSSLPSVPDASGGSASLPPTPSVPVGPQLILAAALQLALASPPTTLSAGVTLFYDAQVRSFTLLFVDSTKRPIAGDVLTVERMKAPTDLTIDNANVCTWIGPDKRKWTLTFADRATALRLIVVYGVAGIILSPPSSYHRADLFKGDGHTLRAKSFAKLSIAVHSIDGGEPHVSLAALLATADASSVSTVTLDDVEIEEEADGAATFGVLINKMKEGSQRLLVVYPSHPLAHSIAPKIRAVTPKTVFACIITAVSVSKKRDKKKAKEKGKKGVTDSVDESAVSSPPTGDLPLSPSPSIDESLNNGSSMLPLPSLPPSSLLPPPPINGLPPPPSITGLPPPPAPTNPPPPSLDTLITAVTEARSAVEQSIAALPKTQTLLVRRLMTEMYDQVTADLVLDKPETPPQPTAAIVDAVSTGLRSVLAAYKNNNATETNGTINTTVNTVQSLLSTLNSLIDDEQAPLHPDNRSKLTSNSSSSSSSSLSSSTSAADKAEIAKLKQQLKQAENRINELSDLQTDLDTSRERIEDLTRALEQSSSEVIKKSEMMTVFESGLSDLRKLLDIETEEKQKYQLNFNHLNIIQKNLKITWLPERVINYCMSCQGQFKIFGKSKNICRYCGRIYCTQCTTVTTVQEIFGNERVRVCNGCVEFRRLNAGELGIIVESREDESKQKAKQKTTLFDEDD